MNSIDTNLECLEKSTMFHMSLGSKELFHSNFLHWISLVNWSAFLEIMHGLADTNEFWWEKENDNNDHYYHPNNKNIKVFREHRKFDLSIYILDSEKKVQEVVDDSDNGKEKDDDPTMEITHDPEGKRKVQKWIPVLVLENKMKSLPYKAQLEEYTKKAFEEWSSGKDTKMKQEAKKQRTLVVNPNEKYSITYILLSLKNTIKLELEDEISHSKISQKPKYCLTLNSRWIGKTYKDLLRLLGSVRLSKTLDDLVLKDYCIFVEALSGLADKWTITSDMNYRSQIFPWGVENQPAKEKIEEINNYKELRIHDIHEKIMYDQLLNLLESKIESKFKRFERFNVKTNQIKYNKGVEIFTNSNYLHGVGVIEAFFVVNNEFRLLLEVQGDRYCHMVLKDNIVKKDTANKKICVNTGVLSETVKDALSKSNYISIGKSKPTFPWNVKPSWGQYGENNVYQYVSIPEKATIEDVVNAMIEDLQNIKKWFK